MPRQIQRTDPSRSLERHFGLKGHIGISLDEVAVPVALLGDFAGRSPYEARGLVGDVQQQVAGGPGTLTGMLITPGAGTLLVVEGLKLVNESGASHNPIWKVLRPVDVAAVTVTGTSPSVLLNGQVRATGFAPQGVATSSVFHHTAQVGADFGRSWVSNGQEVNLELPRGIVLDGTDPDGPISLGFMVQSVNTASPWLSWLATEYMEPR